MSAAAILEFAETGSWEAVGDALGIKASAARSRFRAAEREFRLRILFPVRRGLDGRPLPTHRDLVCLVTPDAHVAQLTHWAARTGGGSPFDMDFDVDDETWMADERSLIRLCSQVVRSMRLPEGVPVLDAQIALETRRLVLTGAGLGQFWQAGEPAEIYIDRVRQFGVTGDRLAGLIEKRHGASPEKADTPIGSRGIVPTGSTW